MEQMTTSELAAQGSVRPLIDVREADEFASGHVPWAVNMPLSELVARVHEIPDGPVNIICQSGGRSARAAEYLEQQHGRQAMNVTGGTGQWIAEGRETAQ